MVEIDGRSTLAAMKGLIDKGGLLVERDVPVARPFVL
jgi:hypothetical protein